MVFENAVLFLRDALISREFSDAVKAGDSGRVVLVLKTWALSFRGNGRTKYAYEMLHLIHNLTSVWSPATRYFIDCLFISDAHLSIQRNSTQLIGCLTQLGIQTAGSKLT
jgi:hypothetical protein